MRGGLPVVGARLSVPSFPPEKPGTSKFDTFELLRRNQRPLLDVLSEYKDVGLKVERNGRRLCCRRVYKFVTFNNLIPTGFDMLARSESYFMIGIAAAVITAAKDDVTREVEGNETADQLSQLFLNFLATAGFLFLLYAVFGVPETLALLFKSSHALTKRARYDFAEDELRTKRAFRSHKLDYDSEGDDDPDAALAHFIRYEDKCDDRWFASARRFVTTLFMTRGLYEACKDEHPHGL